MATSNKNLHLTDDERKIIQRGIENNSSKKSIADTLGKDKSTIGKEIKNHRTLSYKSKYPVECVDTGKCPNKYSHHCSMDCPAFKPLSVKDVTALLAHATAAKDTSAAVLTSTCMMRLLHRKNMLNCSVMHVQVSTLQSMKSEISDFLSSLFWNRDSLSTSSVRTIQRSKYLTGHCIRISKTVYFRMPAFLSPILT